MPVPDPQALETLSCPDPDWSPQGCNSAALVWHDGVHAHNFAAAELPAGPGGYIG